MGNSNHTHRLQDDLDISALRGQPLTFHSLHSDSIRLSHDNRVARRVNSFRGICFSSRPICIFERIYIRIADVASASPSVGREGVLRVGLLCDNPSQLNITDLPTYASPDITYEQGYWAKAVPEPLARQGNVLFFYVTTSGDVIYGLNGKEMGVFFGGVQTYHPLWALMDLYGSTSCLELVDGFQISHYNSYTPAPVDKSWPPSMPPAIPNVSPFYPLSVNSTPPVIAQAWPSSSMASLSTAQNSATQHYGGHTVLEIVDQMSFHHNCGRNVVFSHNLTVASRERHDYCNGYVFTSRPLVLGEKFIVSILSIANEYSGGLAFGMTSCNPSAINKTTLPDDSDLLLDFPDYWVVHKDVCIKPEINDELTFHLMVSGEVRYSKNGHHIGTLMHVDTTLPLWAFLDIYGNTQQIKSLGVITPVADSLSSIRNLPACMLSANFKVNSLRSSLAARFPSTVGMGSLCEKHTLHQSTISSSSKLHMTSPPLDYAKLSDSVSTLSLNSNGTRPSPATELDGTSRRHSYADDPPLALPPKLSQNCSFSVATASSLLPSFTHSSPLDVVLKVSDVPASLPPPLIPMPGKPAVAPKPAVKPTRPQRQTAQKTPSSVPLAGCAAVPLAGCAAVPLAGCAAVPLAGCAAVPLAGCAAVRSQDGGESSGLECVVCMERPTNCALYTCGHMCMCFECAVDIVRNQSGLCPICRDPIKDIIKIFKS